MMTTEIKNKREEKDYLIFNPIMTTEIKAKSNTIFDPVDDDEKSHTQIFYARPGGGKAFYSDMMRPRQTAKGVNQILDAVPLVVQNHLQYKGSFIEIELRGEKK